MPPRKRTNASKKEKETVDATPISEEEQEREIEALRRENEANKQSSRNMLDLLVVVCFFICISQIRRYASTPSGSLLPLAIAQTVLVPLSLSPKWLPFLQGRGWANHPLVAAAHLLLFVAMLILGKTPTTPMPETLRWAVPELVAGAVELQRRSEIQAERSLNRLERLKYPLKGA